MTSSVQLAGGRRVTRWTREAIIEKIVEFDGRYGEPPCSADWNPSLARWRAQEWRAERYRQGRWPSTNAVKRAFDGSFDAAVRAAGFSPARPGPRRAAGAARPDFAQRPPQPPRAVEGDLERRLVAAERRAERAELRLHDARRRARLANDRAGRARRARDRVAAEADTRVRAALDQSEAATRDAEALRRAHEPVSAGGPAGPGVLAAALRTLTAARATGDRHGLWIALGEVAAASLRWRDRL